MTQILASFDRTCFLLEEFTVPSPGQQLLDRFLIGWDRSNDMHFPESPIALHALEIKNASALKARIRDHRDFRDYRLLYAPSVQGALDQSPSVVICPRSNSLAPDPKLIREVLATVPHGSRCFVQGLLAESSQLAQEFFRLARERTTHLTSASSASTPFLLPEIAIPKGNSIQQALAVGIGDFPHAEIEAMQGLLPFFKSHRTESSTDVMVTRLKAGNFWDIVYSAEWEPLFRAALSRSNTIMGDPEKDGRTQDIAGLRLVEKLAPHPRGWMIEHPEGWRTLLLILKGALGERNVAFKLRRGDVISTQLYSPPPPAQDAFNEFARRVELFLRGGPALGEWNELLLPTLLERLKAAAS